MKLFIELRDGVTLQLPFREPSKVRCSPSHHLLSLIRVQNWQWDGKVDVKGRPRKREAATIHVRAGDSSTISYIVPMVATAKGFQSVLEVHLDTVTVTSSLNDIRLLTAETCRVSIDQNRLWSHSCSRSYRYVATCPHLSSGMA